MLTATDRNGNAFLKPVCLAAPKQEHLEQELKDKVDWSNSVLLTDGHTSYRAFAAVNKISHTVVEDTPRGGHHINTVNNMHRQLKQFMDPFNGVATKYLDNYMAFFQFRQKDLSDDLGEGWVSYEDLRQRKMKLK